MVDRRASDRRRQPVQRGLHLRHLQRLDARRRQTEAGQVAPGQRTCRCGRLPSRDRQRAGGPARQTLERPSRGGRRADPQHVTPERSTEAEAEMAGRGLVRHDDGVVWQRGGEATELVVHARHRGRGDEGSGMRHPDGDECGPRGGRQHPRNRAVSPGAIDQHPDAQHRQRQDDRHEAAQQHRHRRPIAHRFAVDERRGQQQPDHEQCRRRPIVDDPDDRPGHRQADAERADEHHQVPAGHLRPDPIRRGRENRDEDERRHAARQPGSLEAAATAATRARRPPAPAAAADGWRR